MQSFGGRPSVFVSAEYTRDTKPDDAMYVWLENVKSGSFEVCIREFLPFDGKHQDTIVVGTRNVEFCHISKIGSEIENLEKRTERLTLYFVIFLYLIPLHFEFQWK